MNCLTAFVLSCLFDPQNLYVTGQLQVQLEQANYGRRWCYPDWCNGKIGEVRLGMTINLTRQLEAEYGVLHRSFWDTSFDQGEQAAFASVTWRPFRK